MACFLVSVAEAIIMTAVTKAVKSKESEPEEIHFEAGADVIESATRIPFSRKLKWLTNMLWGGSALLAFEHLWHGEIAPWFPFLTAASDSVQTSVMLHEMATVGVTMAVLITAVWGVMLLVSNAMEKKLLNSQHSVNYEARK
ncbi:MAG TPA: hypothetical protein PKV44_02480 [Bacillota bacterium]|nr:hypothetical protein [Bacillota bacterium]HPE38477.1 hypothetical protein [Bacillota bacterium]